MNKPKITLKGLKHSAFASHETLCFEATVIVDGVPFCVASNDGQGGPENFVPLPKSKATYGDINKRIAEMDVIFNQEKIPVGEDGQTLDNDFSMEVVAAVDRVLLLKKFQRLFRQHIVCIEDGKAVQYNYRRPLTPALIEAFKGKRPGVKILNDLPEEEVIAAMKSL